ncbi:HD-GYP domain-containing protein [Deinococcus maricopensis]|uniref:Metal dependent phosphohydrolase with GAF sensor n=1 Tax=Deinococcus maricopensis (strain DSM 21211 / LMG 22137 / NRRL B-23946 / LB-34) TaxID=709986 RepID=E8U4A1_DEIML|nr:HD domain-containing phosphohydrolase [Deinococcus maricopensis]ADV65938.1 metal dependent phosphohydrolase with GAF sensor [Deinococcus maricopensis DSM 21211]
MPPHDQPDPLPLASSPLDRLRQLEALASVSVALRDARHPHEVESLLIGQAHNLVHTPHAAFVQYDADEDRLVCTAGAGHYLSDVGFEVPRDAGLAWVAVRERRLVHAPDIQQEPRAHARGRDRHASVVMVPLQASTGAVFGVLLLLRDELHAFTDLDVRVAQTIAGVGAAALERMHATETIRQKVLELQATREGALRALGLALELRDFETTGHTARVVSLAAQLGEALNLSDEERQTLRDGAYLHDIGKLAVPDTVLLKPGSLDANEWAVMQAHVTHGFTLSGYIPSLREGVRDVVRSHHERWDGTGYPDGLAGEAIPWLARIFAVCDVYDALTSERPYKRAWTPEAALAEIRAQAGRHFDPRVVEAFVTLLAFATPEA